MKQKRSTLAYLAALTTMSLVGTGCATSFTGAAHVENARAGCEAKCTGQGLELVGMVYMGEYSDACVCAVPGLRASAKSEQLLSRATAGATGGAVGVVMAMRDRQTRQNQDRVTTLHY